MERDGVNTMAEPQLKLRRAVIRGFKALDGVDLRLPENLTVLIGPNGAGKSTVLQSLAFVPYFIKGQPASFFTERHWTSDDIRCRLGKEKPVVEMIFFLEKPGIERILWAFSYDIAGEMLLSELVVNWPKGYRGPNVILLYGKYGLSFPDRGGYRGSDNIKPIGSYLSVLDFDSFGKNMSQIFRAVRRWGEGIFSLELLNPSAMREGGQGTHTDIGARGEHLGGFLAALPANKKDRLVKRLGAFYPLESLDTVRKRAGWIDLKIAESYKSLGSLNAGHMSDGFMRLLGLASIPEFSNKISLVLLDEIEDGIDPHILPDLVRLIANESSAQLLVTSHSPLLVNTFEPAEISFMARDEDGRCLAARFGEIQEVQKDLEYLGPGEIWSHTDLNTITGWVRALHRERREAGSVGQSGKPTKSDDLVHIISGFMEGQ